MSIRRIVIVTMATLSLGSSTAVAAPQLFIAQNSNFTKSENINPSKDKQSLKNGFGRKGEGRWLEQLNLSPEQVKEIQEIRNQHDSKIKRKSQELRQAHEKLRELMTADASTNAIRQQHSRVNQLRQEMGELKFERMLAIREVLEPEQRQQLANWMQSKPGHGRYGRRGGYSRHGGYGRSEESDLDD